MLRAALRAVLIAAIVAVHLAAAARAGGRDLRRTILRTSRWSRRACRVLGLRLRRHGAMGAGGGLVVCNHLSWIDPLLLAAWRPAVFVTSVETGEEGFLGRVCAAAGCVFMERRRRSGLVDECRGLAALLREHAVVVFPEATSSDGSRLLPFRPAAFAAAIAAEAAVQPLALRYIGLDGRAVTGRNRDLVCWHGDMTFLPHFCRLLAIGRVDAEMVIHGSVPTRGRPCRKALARHAHATIAASLRPHACNPPVAQRMPARTWAADVRA